MLAGFWLAPTGACDDSDDPRAGTGVIGLPRTRSSARCSLTCSPEHRRAAGGGGVCGGTGRRVGEGRVCPARVGSMPSSGHGVGGRCQWNSNQAADYPRRMVRVDVRQTSPNLCDRLIEDSLRRPRLTGVRRRKRAEPSVRSSVSRQPRRGGAAMPGGPKLERLDPPAFRTHVGFPRRATLPERVQRALRGKERSLALRIAAIRRRSAIRGTPHITRGLVPMFETNLRLILRSCPRSL